MAPEIPVDPASASQTSLGSGTPKKKGRGLLSKLVVSLLLGALFAYLVSKGGVPLIPQADALAQVTWWAVPAYLGILLVAHYFRASRWRFLIEPVHPVSIRDSIALNWVGFFAIFAFPLRLGEFARPALTKIRHGVPISAGMGTVAVERVVDGLLASLCVAWALFVLPTRPTDDPLARALPIYGYLAMAVFGAAMAMLLLFLWKEQWSARLVRRMAGWISPTTGDWIADKVSSVADGVRSLSRLDLSLKFLAETLAYWALNAASMWVLALGVGLPFTFGHAVAVMGVLAIGILLPAGPGMFGNFQLAISAGLKLYFAEQLVGFEGAVYIFLLYTAQALFLATTGIIPLYIMKIPFKALFSPDATPSGASPSGTSPSGTAPSEVASPTHSPESGA